MLTVTVYSTGPSCMRCTLTKKALAKEGVPFVEVDVRENPDARAYITEDLGYSEAPVCIVEDGTGVVSWSLVEASTLKAMNGSYTLEAMDGGTHVTYRLAVDLTIPMLGTLRRKAEKVIVESALRNLKAHVEG